MRKLALVMLLLASPALAQSPPPAPPQDGLSWQGLKPTWRALDGSFTLTPVLRLDLDSASYLDQSRPGGVGSGGFRSGANLRRGYVGVTGRVAQDFEYNFTWDLGGDNPGDWNALYQLWLAWHVRPWATLRVGVYEPIHTLQYAQSSFDVPFMERASVINAVASLGAGAYREAMGAELHGERWVASGYLTGGQTTVHFDQAQRALAGRAAGLLVDEGGWQVQLGGSVIHQFRPGAGSAEAQRLRDYPELRGSSTRLLDTRGIVADAAWAAGPELAVGYGPAFLQAEYYHFGVERPNGQARRDFDGWYLEGTVSLLGPPRRRSAERGVWTRPAVMEAFDPAAGHLGAVEAAARFSSLDLRDDGTRGGRQRIWTGALNWYPTRQLRLTVEYQNGVLDQDARPLHFQAVGLRAAFNL